MFNLSALRSGSQIGGGNEMCVHGLYPHEGQGEKKEKGSERGMERTRQVRDSRELCIFIDCRYSSPT